MRPKRTTETLADIAEVIGWDAVLQLVRCFGGQRFYVRQKLKVEDALVAAIGQEAAEALAQIYGGDEIYLPISLRREIECRALMAQKPPLKDEEIVRKVGVSYRYISKLRGTKPTPLPGNDQEDRQLPLFGG
ncbi:MAG: Mor transcription activator family protein [Sphingorhabdus sp.]